MAGLVRALGSRFAGVDLLTNDPTVPLAESRGVFVEINTTPGLHHHYITAEDHERHPVAARILDRLLRDGHPA